MNTSKISDILPFQMHENVYFIGSTRVSVHLIKTSAGLVMIDTGYPEMHDQILHSMETLGFDIKEVCAILHSHGHIDHFANTIRFKEYSGAKTYISRIDNDITNGTLDLSWAKELGYPTLPFFDCDVLIDDGDVLTFGDTTVRCLLTSGHTDGVLTFLITLPDGNIAAMHGGVGMNTLKADFLNAYGLSFDCREIFRQGLHRLANEHVDLVLGNHPHQNDTQGKRIKAVEEHLSLIDPTEWNRFLLRSEHNLDKLIEKEKNA